MLVVAAVAGLHGLYRAGGDVAAWSVWVVELLAGMTALGGGIKLAMWGFRPMIVAVSTAAKERLSEPVQAVAAALAVIAGALGMWWIFRGGYNAWWQHLSGAPGWTLLLGIGQMLVAVLAGAALFTGGRYLTGLAAEVLADAGMLGARDRASDAEGAGAHRHTAANALGGDEKLWHPGLLAALIAGGAGLVLLAAGITPKLYVWITGPDVLPAVLAIAATLVWGIGANLGWWKGLAGLYTWATDASQKATATAGVVAVLMFSASGLGLGWFTPATVPQAHAQCPPDCGGGDGGSYGPPNGGQMFQPPSQGGQQLPDYQGGINQPPMDQNSSISIYNTQAPSISNNGSSGSSGQQGPQQSWDQPAHGTQIPDYQTATPYTQGPGRPNPDFNPGLQGAQSNPGSNAGSQGGQADQGAQSGNQGAQQPQQQPPQNQPPRNNTGQQPPQQNTEQPNQSDQQRLDELTRQLQDQQQQSSQDRQRIDDLTKQLQQQGQQRQNGNQKLPKAPSKDKKQDDKNKQDQDDQSQSNDLSALLLGAASTRRRKQGDQSQPDQQQQQGPDTQALAQDGAQLGQSLPGDIANTVSDSVNLGQSAGSAAQNFGSAAQAGASLASSAQSGAVNPMDAVALVQGVSGGISDTADAVGSGASIASTWLNNAGQGAQLAADVNPQLKAEAERVQQLSQAGGQVADLTGQVAGGVSQVSGVVNTVSSLGASGMPDTSGVGDAADALSGTATAVNGPGDVPKPTPPTPSQPSSASQLLGNMVGGPQQPTQPASTGNPNAGSLQGILQPPPSADAVQKQLDLVNQAQDRVRQAQSVVDQSAAQVYMSPQNAPGPDDVKRQGQALFDARRELTDQTLALTEMNQRLIDNGQPPIQIPLLPDNVSRQAFPPEPSKAQEFSGAWSEFSKSTYGIVPDIPTDIRTATNFDQASGADKASLALDGIAVVPGLGAIGRGLKGIEGIRGGEAAIRAADDIPLPSKPVGTSVVTDVTKQGGQAVYQGLDNLGRPTGITARITPDMIGTGTRAGKATPPGWIPDNGLARGHMLAKVLGGSGTESRNIVSIIQNPVNSPVMRDFEMSVANAVKGGQAVDYAVTPLYRGAAEMPEAVQIIAKGSDGFDLAVTVLNR
ncbi:DNA/RNA non-specific endonuclease family protein [Mycobacteroides abscessus subsp. bolletii 1513]|uniref:DNA/RNA non-specific endonuclease family protein n=1 Tax=Mycobacteroides abscessus subsp. bolletii 1513 TaxID=1299321 RepID=X8DRC1_9MYCO|nr:DNA/RNA non-specific endonuclease family protein [Mycobacteroides abscessus subsp. bolletii 1513]